MKNLQSKIAIFIADDDPDEMCLFKNALDDVEIPHDLAWFKNGELLLSNLKNDDFKNPDIIFLDLNMPVMSGLECLTAIRNSENLKALKVIIYSTSDNPTDIKNTFAAEADFYLKKPGTYGQLKKILHEILIGDFLSHRIRHDLKYYLL